jgi:hypothetical protein
MARKNDPEPVAPTPQEADQPAPEQLPQSGGRYVRWPDGTLRPADDSETKE